MDRNDNQDALDSILDSITMDDTMERKIHEFSQNKKRSRRIQRARDESAKFQETYASARKDTGKEASDIVLGQDDYHQASRIQSESTQTFDARTLTEPQSLHPNPSRESTGTSARPDRFADHQAGQTIVPGSSQEQQIRAKIAAAESAQNLAASRVHPVYSTSAPNAYDQNAVPSQEMEATRVHTNLYSQDRSHSAGPASLDNTRIHTPAANGRSSGSGGYGQPLHQTRVYDNGLDAMPASHSSQTVVMDEQEIQNYMEDDSPVLKREYVGPAASVRPPSRGFNWKIPLSVVGIVLIGILGVGAFQFVSGWMGSLSNIQQQTSSSQGYYDELLQWANQYSSLSEAERKDITSMERIYNRLNENQRSEINKILTTMTGKTFDELLAAASAGDKQESNNNNTEIAEKKAELKSQIASLQKELDNLTASNKTSQADLDAAFAVLTDRTSSQEKAAKELQEAQDQLDQANSALAPYLQSQTELQSQLTAAQAELDALLAESSVTQPGEEGEDTPPLENPSIQNARQKVEALSKQLDQVSQQMQTAQNAVDQATTSVNNAQVIYDNASSQVTEAQDNYNSLKDSTPNNQAEIDSINAQIQNLQDQLNRL